MAANPKPVVRRTKEVGEDNAIISDLKKGIADMEKRLGKLARKAVGNKLSESEQAEYARLRKQIRDLRDYVKKLEDAWKRPK